MTDRMEHLDEGTIHAWLDGALSPDESARVESHINSCADCTALVAEARGLVAASSRILASLDAVPAGVVPGTDSGTDQLAALRARRAATRVWWRDRRFVAAASLVLVAGVSSVVWRTVGNQPPTAMESARALDSIALPAAAPSPAPVVAPTDAKTEAEPPSRNAALTRVATRADSTTNAKVAATGPVPGAVAEMTAESRARGAGQQRDAANAAGARTMIVGAAVAPSQPPQTVDSTKALARGEQSAFERKVQQQLQTPPTPPRIIPEQQQQGAANAPAPRSLAPRVADSATVTSGTGAARRMDVTAASISAGARVLDPDSPAGGCYALGSSPPANDRLAAADTVVLLDMPSPERSDPTWFLARPARGSSNTVMRWRQVDSMTVELRTDSRVLRFHTRPGVAGLPDVRSVAGVRAMWSLKVRCP